jgi:DNA topoisomerase-1
MNVVIVESPSKAKTINKYLGKDYTVLASYGHVRDLPSKEGSVNTQDGFSMVWEMDTRGQKQMQEIASAVKSADAVLLATDPDREGEAISWHVREVLNQKKKLTIPVKRIVFYEITQKAVKEALNQPRDLDEGLIQAYLARRALDYLVGFTLSPVLWRKLPGSRSAGRVQSVALRIVADREGEIEAFISQEYWSIHGLFGTSDGKDLKGKLMTFDGQKLDKMDIKGGPQADEMITMLKGLSFHVHSVEKKQTKRHPSPPFTTSTLQQEAARKLRFSAKKTMQVAQKLYEGIALAGETVGLITYMRTDSTNISAEAIDSTRGLIGKTFGDVYVPQSPRVFKSKSKNAQEAHEAIRPTGVGRTPAEMKGYLEDDQYKLYDLIWKRMVASQMESALIDQVSIDMADPSVRHLFRATGSRVHFDGFLKVYVDGRDADETPEDEDEKFLPTVHEKDPLTTKEITGDQHFTQPPPRFSEASLVKKLEELGIGRPSTYASIMSTLLDRKYVRIEKNQLIPETLGRLVTSFLSSYFKRYVEYDFTAQMEEKLDEIADGKAQWQQTLTEFWEAFQQAVKETSALKITDVIDHLNHDLERFLFGPPTEPEGSVNRRCPQCDTGTMSLKLGKFGAFLGCSDYPTCNYTRKLTGTAGNDEAQDMQETPSSFETQILGNDPKTGQTITLRKGPYGFYFQWGEAVGKEKPKRASLPQGATPTEATLDMALRLGALPVSLGAHPETGQEMTLGQGRFGPYVKYQDKFFSLAKNDSIATMTPERAVELIAAKLSKPSFSRKKA